MGHRVGHQRMGDLMPRHLAWPPRLTPGGTVLATNEQDTPTDLRDRAALVLATRRGSLIFQPAFGLPEQAFRQGGASLDEIREQIAQWEPNIRSEAVVTDEDLAAMTESVAVQVGEATQ